jgi:hypothetical protein
MIFKICPNKISKFYMRIPKFLLAAVCIFAFKQSIQAQWTNNPNPTVVGGKVGIGTSSPNAVLEVISNGQATGDDAVFFEKPHDPTPKGQRFTFNNVGGLTSETPGPAWRGFHIAAPYTTFNGSLVFPRMIIYAEYDSYTNPSVRKWVFHAGNSSANSLHDIEFKNEQTSMMYIKGNGNIGIGTSNPLEKLTVNGTVCATKIKASLSGCWADYVFEAGYRLRPISEVEQFINQYHHLPEVPSAAEVERNGLDVADNQTTLLKKIEELTLYIIEMNKQIKLLQEENVQLKNLVLKNK